MSRYIEYCGGGYTFWDCGYCGDVAPKENFMDWMYWQKGDGKHQCFLCYDQEQERHRKEDAYWQSPEGQLELEKLKSESEQKCKKDLEENYNFYEGNCPECLTYNARYVKNDATNQTPSLYCGCRDRADNEERIGRC